jgi:hypothetical protein
MEEYLRKLKELDENGVKYRSIKHRYQMLISEALSTLSLLEEKATRAAKEKQNDEMMHQGIDQFLSEKTIENGTVPAVELYMAYTTFTMALDIVPVSNREFANYLLSKGIERKKQSVGYVYMSISLRLDLLPTW